MPSAASEEGNDALSRFCSVAGCDDQTARFLLEASGGDFEVALNTFFGKLNDQKLRGMLAFAY